MAEFVAFNPIVEVNGQTMLSFVNCISRGKALRAKILANHNLIPQANQWFPMQLWLNAFKNLADTVGELNLFLIGKSITKNAAFPPIKGLEQALSSLNVAYHMNHRLEGKIMFNSTTGNMLDGIGQYELLHFDPSERTATMKCSNPYPSKFDEGIIYELVNKFKPKDSTQHEVKIDINQERRSKGGDSCTY
ncbi:MAG: hypothetical protein MK212_12075, partial [Saprospiraceae bacterium]|nr:hypothetical protein [Saprospiraceae bacterium]